MNDENDTLDPIDSFFRIIRAPSLWGPLAFQAGYTVYLALSNAYRGYNERYLEGIYAGRNDVISNKTYNGPSQKELETLDEKGRAINAAEIVFFPVGIALASGAAYSLAYAAGRTNRLSKKLYYLTAALACLGLDISMVVIALWVNNDFKQIGFKFGYHNGYADSYCKEFSCKEEDLPKNNTFPAEPYGQQIDANKYLTLSRPEVALPLSTAVGLSLLVSGYRKGKKQRNDYQAIQDDTQQLSL